MHQSFTDFSSLRKVMLRTCLDTADTSTKEFPTATSTTPATAQPPSTSYSASCEKIYDNGDIFSNKADPHAAVYRQATAFTDQFPIPEEIPGLPRHRPGEYSPTYDRRSARGYWIHFDTFQTHLDVFQTQSSISFTGYLRLHLMADCFIKEAVESTEPPSYCLMTKLVNSQEAARVPLPMEAIAGKGPR